MRGVNHGEDFGWSVAPRFGGGGGSSQPSTTTQTTTPWSGQIPYLTGPQGVFPAAQNLYTNTSDYPQFYGGLPGVTSPVGPTYVPMTAQQQGLQGAVEDYGIYGGSGSLQAANTNIANTTAPSYTAGTSGAFNTGQGYLSNMIGGATLNPFAAPGFQNVVNQTLANVMPSVESSFIGGNRADSGLATAAATNAATNAVGSLANQNYLTEQQLQQGAEGLAANNYLTQQGNQVKADALAPMIDQSQLGDLTTALSASGMSQQDLQNAVNSAISQWNYNQTLPFNMLGQYQGYVGGGGYGGTTTTTTPYYSNTGANLLGGALGGAALGASVLPTLIGTGSGASAGIGSLLGLGLAFSDRKLKTDIHKIGESDSGFPLFSFRYKWEPKGEFHVGLMAQDVAKKRPEAVVRTPFGLAVNYDMALAA